MSEEKKGNFGKFLMAALIGGAVGTALGLIFAPKSGKETRNAIYNKLRKHALVKKEAKILKNLIFHEDK